MSDDYEIAILKQQVQELEAALNEVRAKLGLSEIQLVKPAAGERRGDERFG